MQTQDGALSTCEDIEESDVVKLEHRRDVCRSFRQGFVKCDERIELQIRPENVLNCQFVKVEHQRVVVGRPVVNVMQSRGYFGRDVVSGVI